MESIDEKTAQNQEQDDTPQDQGRKSLGELDSDIDGLIQLATWQLALARDIKSQAIRPICAPREAQAGIDQKTARNQGQADTPQDQGQKAPETSQAEEFDIDDKEPQLTHEDRDSGIILGAGELNYLQVLATEWGMNPEREASAAWACGQVQVGIDTFDDNDGGLRGDIVHSLVDILRIRLCQLGDDDPRLVGDDNDSRWAERAVASGILKTIEDVRLRMIEARNRAGQPA